VVKFACWAIIVVLFLVRFRLTIVHVLEAFYVLPLWQRLGLAALTIPALFVLHVVHVYFNRAVVIVHECIHGAILLAFRYKVNYSLNWRNPKGGLFVVTYDQLQWRGSMMAVLIAPVLVITPICVWLLATAPIWVFIPAAAALLLNTPGSITDVEAFLWFWRKPRGTCTLIDRENNTFTFEPVR
jgi:hypothetical protein